jgi:DNA-binding MarR family transcriptional regulator
MGELGTALRVDPSTATRSVAPLVEAGLVVRTTDPADGRRVLVRLTPKGRARLAKAVKRGQSLWEQLLEDFSHREREQFIEFIERLVATIDRIAGSGEE